MSAPNDSSSFSGATAPRLRRLPYLFRLSPQFITRLAAEAERGPGARTPSMGLLFGVRESGQAAVEAYRPLPAQTFERPSEVFFDQYNLEQLKTSAKTDPELAGLSVLGWYTIRPTGRLTALDVEFHQQSFPGTNDLALIVGRDPATRNIALDLYSRCVEGVLSTEAHRCGSISLANATPIEGAVEVPMRAKTHEGVQPGQNEACGDQGEDPGLRWKELISSSTKTVGGPANGPSTGRYEHGRPSTGTPLADNLQHQEDNSFERNPLQTSKPAEEFQPAEAARDTSRVPWMPMAAAFAVAAGLTFGFVYVHALRSDGGLSGYFQTLWPTLSSAGSSNQVLDLRLIAQGERLQLSWDRKNAAVRTAKSGMLEIMDGAEHRTIPLSSGELAEGSVLYQPNSTDVVFRLEVRGSRGNNVTETMRVLGQLTVRNSDIGVPQRTAQPKRYERAPLQTASVEAGRIPRDSGLAATGTGAPSAHASGSDNVNRSEASLPAAKLASANKTNVPSASTKAESATPATEKKGEIVASGQAPNGARSKGEEGPWGPVAGGESQLAALASSAAHFPAGRPTQNLELPKVAEKQNVPPTVPAQTPRPPLPTPPLPTPPLPTQPQSNPVVQPQAPAATPVPYQPPRPKRQVLPNLQTLQPGIATGLGQISVQVSVDEHGTVTDAQVLTGSKKIGPAVRSAVVQAARQWIFQPALLRGRAIPSRHTILFQFHSAG